MGPALAQRATDRITKAEVSLQADLDVISRLQTLKDCGKDLLTLTSQLAKTINQSLVRDQRGDTESPTTTREF